MKFSSATSIHETFTIVELTKPASTLGWMILNIPGLILTSHIDKHSYLVGMVTAANLVTGLFHMETVFYWPKCGPRWYDFSLDMAGKKTRSTCFSVILILWNHTKRSNISSCLEYFWTKRFPFDWRIISIDLGHFLNTDCQVVHICTDYKHYKNR